MAKNSNNNSGFILPGHVETEGPCRVDAYTAPTRKVEAPKVLFTPDPAIAAGKQTGNQNTITVTGRASSSTPDDGGVFTVSKIVRDQIAKRIAKERGLDIPTREDETKRDNEHTSQKTPSSRRRYGNKTAIEGVIPVDGAVNRKWTAAKNYR